MTGVHNYGIFCKVANAGDMVGDEEQGEPFLLFQTQQQVEHIQEEILEFHGSWPLWQWIY
jgi:hypothetical protein